MEKLKKMTDELKEKLITAIKSEEIQKAIKNIKEANDTGTFEIIISTEDVDRAGEIIKQNGWDFSFYMKNPVVLWAHSYSGLPIGITEDIKVEGTKTIAKGKFAPSDEAQQIRKLYEAGFIRTASVGFIPLEMEENTIIKAELLEWSFVPVPANPQAISLLGVEAVEGLVAKGILIKEETPENDDKDDENQEVDDTIETEENATEKPEINENEIESNEENIENNEKADLVKLAGSIMSKTQNKIDQLLIQASKDILAILSQKTVVAGQEGPADTEPESSKKEEAKQRSVSKRSEYDEIKDFVMTRKLLKSVDNVVNEALAKLNKRAKEFKSQNYK